MRFEQGNKRMAFAALRLFLRANGYDTAFDDTVAWADEIISRVEHRARILFDAFSHSSSPSAEVRAAEQSACVGPIVRLA
jgi:prophage maintenance system killer protein